MEIWGTEPIRFYENPKSSGLFGSNRPEVIPQYIFFE